jgi:hypothetical protein
MSLSRAEGGFAVLGLAAGFFVALFLGAASRGLSFFGALRAVAFFAAALPVRPFFGAVFLPFRIAIDPAIFEVFGATRFRHPLILKWTMTASVTTTIPAFKMEFFRHDHPAFLTVIKIFSFNQLFHRCRL